MNAGTTIVRGVLYLVAYSKQHSAIRAELFDATGRKVRALHKGANDVRPLTPGVCLVQSTIDNRQSAMVRVVITH